MEECVSYVNPYFDNSFFEFFLTLGRRIGLFCSGQEITLASDELQILVLSLIAITASCVGTFLVLRKMTMVANALSHTILAGIVLAYFVYRIGHFGGDNLDLSHLFPQSSLLLCSSLLMAFLTTFLTEFLTKKAALPEDAACGIVFTFLFALGVILVTLLSRDTHIGAELLMGNSDALHFDDFSLQWKVTLLNVALFFIFYRGFAMTTFDPLFSRLLGFQPAFFGYLLMGQVALSATSAFRAVGVLLVLGFFVLPPLIARNFTHRLLPLLLLSAVIGMIASFVGVGLGRHLLSVFELPVSTSALVVTLLALTYVTVLLNPYKA